MEVATLHSQEGLQSRNLENICIFLVFLLFSSYLALRILAAAPLISPK